MPRFRSITFKIPLFCKIIFHAYTLNKNDDQNGITTKTNSIFGPGKKRLFQFISMFFWFSLFS